MQQLCARQLVFKLGQSAIFKRCAHHVNAVENKKLEVDHHEHVLICPRWEEAIIREHRTDDLSFDTMQKHTIDAVNRDDIKKQPRH